MYLSNGAWQITNVARTAGGCTNYLSCAPCASPLWMSSTAAMLPASPAAALWSRQPSWQTARSLAGPAP